VRISRYAFVVLGLPTTALAQAGVHTSNACISQRVISTLVGAGLGAAVAAAPATIAHRHDQTTSYRILIGSVAIGTAVGFVAGGHDASCTTRSDSTLSTPTATPRAHHAASGAIAGAIVGGVAGAVGGTFYQLGCYQSCNATRQRAGVMLFSAAEGAAAGSLLGGLIGWAWPRGHP
jgi:hypothetical protein